MSYRCWVPGCKPATRFRVQIKGGPVLVQLPEGVPQPFSQTISGDLCDEHYKQFDKLGWLIHSEDDEE
jgi:hypothetical protein